MNRIRSKNSFQRSAIIKGAAASEKLAVHVKIMLKCRQCHEMRSTPVSGGPVVSKVISVGQAPGDKEPKLNRPFAWTAGKTLFGWFKEYAGMSEAKYRSSIYMAAVCRCFPGKKAGGGDRVPYPYEVKNCLVWLNSEIEILKPALVIPIGKLAIAQFLPAQNLDKIIGRKFKVTREGHTFDVICLPHPSGASPWRYQQPGKTLLKRALKLIVKHPAFISSTKR